MSSSKALRRLLRKLTVEILWIYVVRVLMSFGPMRAYEIKKKISEVFELRVPTITVYTVIYRLCNEGLLESVRIGAEVMYRVTDKGVEEFAKALEFLDKTISKLKQ
uniref:PadR family transcriptional regulator n=1 Tax=Ignisphaera aggregans TaxID=334771 RepID=A0A7C2VNL1_9CREN